MGVDTRASKRKRSLDEPALLGTRKKAPKPSLREVTAGKAAATKGSPTCPLIQALRQYGLLESITSSLFPSDLLALALSCKATYNAMFPRPESVENLLSRVPCSGSGVVTRQRLHKKSTFFYTFPCTEFAQCSTISGRQNIETRPCVSCKVTTCDECRIHCVYQSIFETPSDPQGLPNFSGFVLLNPPEVTILSPHHLPHELLPCEAAHLAPWRNRAIDCAAGPYHDEGFLDMSLESDESGTPEKIRDVLEVDLGHVSLTTWSASSQFGFPSPVLRSLCDVAEKRKISLCKHCSQDALKGYQSIGPALPILPWLSDNKNSCTSGKALNKCHCSLRSRILDRWQCVRCYENEDSILQSIHSPAPTPTSRRCRCGLSAQKTVCMWCWGEVTEGRDVYEELNAEDSAHPRAQRGD